MTVDAQLTIWIAHFIPPVQAMPTRRERSSAPVAGWLSVLEGVGDGCATIVLIGGLPVEVVGTTRILRAQVFVCPFRETNGRGTAARRSFATSAISHDGAEA